MAITIHAMTAIMAILSILAIMAWHIIILDTVDISVFANESGIEKFT